MYIDSNSILFQINYLEMSTEMSIIIEMNYNIRVAPDIRPFLLSGIQSDIRF